MGLIDVKFDFKKIFNQKTFMYVIIGGLILYILSLQYCSGSKDQSEKEALMKELLKLDKTVQESNGSYKKLVNNFSTENELKKELLGINQELAKTIKKQNERLLMITDVVASFDTKLDKGLSVNVKWDSITGQKVISFVTRYPSNDNNNDE